MLDGSNGGSSNPSEVTWTDGDHTYEWQAIDRTLRGLAKQRAKLDAEESRWLREADRIQIWRQFGCASLVDYMERRLGYGVRAAQERLRVAFALAKLPQLEAKLEEGKILFSAARDLTRVATPATEKNWLEASENKTVAEVQQSVVGRQEGDLPTDPPKPELVMKVLRYHVKSATYALERQAKAALERRLGHRVDDDMLISACFAAVLEATASNKVASDASGDALSDAATTAPAVPTIAKYQIAVTLCRRCEQGWQQGDGVQAPMDHAAIERAKCDAQHIGALDTNKPERAVQDVTPKVRRFIWRRDGGKCAMTNCRSTRNLDIHHIIAREDGGAHTPENLTLLCEAHHTLLHEGLVTITGEAPSRLVITRRHEGPTVTATKFDRAAISVAARAELLKQGFTRPEAAAAVDIARGRMGMNTSIEALVREALERRTKT